MWHYKPLFSYFKAVSNCIRTKQCLNALQTSFVEHLLMTTVILLHFYEVCRVYLDIAEC